MIENNLLMSHEQTRTFHENINEFCVLSCLFVAKNFYGKQKNPGR
jgi:hypothetical protein